jgi:phosphate/sulfate permease
MIDLVELPIERWLAGAVACYMAWSIGANNIANAMGREASGREH